MAGPDARRRLGPPADPDPGASPHAGVTEMNEMNEMNEPASRSPSVNIDPWARLRQHTAARIALGRSGSSLPTDELLRFALDHALARDAVHCELDVDQLEKDVAAAVGDLP